MTDVKLHETKVVPTSEIRLNRWNPNVEETATFNQLVENIRQVGMTVPIQVRTLGDADLSEDERASGVKYEIVGGEHRLRAAQVLEMGAVPATILEGWAEDLAQFQTVALNVIAGKVDRRKFTRLVEELVRKGYEEDAIAQMMRFAEPTDMDRLIIAAKESLPAELAQQLERSRDEIRNVDDLSRILNSLFATYGATLEHSFMVFDFGGKRHWWIRGNRRLLGHMETFAAICQDRKLDMNEVLSVVFDGGMPALAGIGA